MRRPLGTLLLVGVAALGAAQLARSDDDALPLDIQVIIVKVSAGIAPTAADAKRLEEYAVRHRDDAVDGVTFGDVVAIVGSVQKTGNRPSSDDAQRMRTWASGMKSRQEQMKKDAKALAKKLEAAAPPGSQTATGSAANPGLGSGSIVFECRENVTDDIVGPQAETHNTLAETFAATFPVHFDVTDANGDLSISWSLDSSGGKPVTVDFTLFYDSNKNLGNGHSRETVSSKATGPVQAALAHCTVNGQLVAAKSARRPYLKCVAGTTEGALETTHTHTVLKNQKRENGQNSDLVTDDDKTSQAPATSPSKPSLDDVAALDGPFLGDPRIPEQYRKIALDALSKNLTPELKAAAAGATCTFDAESFRRLRAVGKPFRASITYVYHIIQAKTSGSGQENTARDVMTTITLQLGPNDSDLEIIPGPAPMITAANPATVDLDVYHNWLPLPYTDDPEAMRAFNVAKNDGTKTLGFLVSWKPKPGQPLTEGTIRLHLASLSENRGLCINYPKGAEAKDGLFFPTGNAGNGKPVQPDEAKLDISADGLTATTKKPVSQVVIYVAARDAGAYGLLEASCPERGMAAIWKVTGKPDVSIPEDTNHNHIADAWEKNRGIFDRNRAETWDAESVPDGPSLGDGITLYDEYRGILCEDPGSTTGEIFHRRLDPTVKKLFVYVDEGYLWPAPAGTAAWPDIVRAGAGVYAAASGVPVTILRKPESVKFVDPKKPPIVNFNSEAKPAYGVRVAQASPNLQDDTKAPPEQAKGTTPGLTDADHVSTDPSDCEAVYISLQNMNVRFDFWRDSWFTDAFWFALKPDQTPKLPFSTSWCKLRNLDLDKDVRPKVDPARARLTNQYAAFTLCHELAHATGAWHHAPDIFEGDHFCPMRYWDSGHIEWCVPLILGGWDPGANVLVPAEKPADEKFVPWKFCSEHQGTFPRLKPK